MDIVRNNTIVDIWKMLVSVGVCKTNSEARRVIEANSFKVFNDNWEPLDMFSLQDGQTPRFAVVKDVDGKIFRVGKRKFFKININ